MTTQTHDLDEDDIRRQARMAAADAAERTSDAAKLKVMMTATMFADDPELWMGDMVEAARAWVAADAAHTEAILAI